jgi:sporulation protein YlmC with PRC-barrel domain
MAETSQQFTIGSEVSCTDGPCGELRWVVVDPVARAVTHLVVEAKHRSGLGRLVPLDLVDTTSGDLRLNCTRAEFDNLDHAEETQFLPGSGSGFGTYAPGQAVVWPYYGLGGGGFLAETGVENVAQFVVADSVPPGDVAVRRGDRVHATDGTIGKVQGLVIDPGNGHVTHVLLQEGHIWDRKEVAIPIGAVTTIGDDGIHLDISETQVGALPSIDVHHPEI